MNKLQNIKEEYNKKSIQRILNSPELMEHHKKQIKEYHYHLIANGDRIRKSATILNIMRCLKSFAVNMNKKPFEQITKQDIEFYLNSNHTRHNTKMGVLSSTKPFLKWLNNEVCPECISWINPKLKCKTIAKQDLIDEHDILKMLQTINGKDQISIRNRCLLAVLMDSGCRVGELLMCRIKDLIKDKYGYSLSITAGKTGHRQIRLIKSVIFLNTWVEVHPKKSDKESPLFCALHKNFGDGLSYSSVLEFLSRTAKKANITKEVNPHSWRHFKATDLAEVGLSEYEMNLHFGWTQGSKMSAKYNCQNYQSVSKKLLRLNGTIIDEEPEKSVFDKIICPKCGSQVMPELDSCEDCGQLIKFRFNDVEKEKVDNSKKVLDFAFKDPLLRDRLTSILQEAVSKMPI